MLRSNSTCYFSAYPYLLFKSDITVTNISNIRPILPTTWRQKLAGIDKERNYVTVTRCISGRCLYVRAQAAVSSAVRQSCAAGKTVRQHIVEEQGGYCLDAARVEEQLRSAGYVTQSPLIFCSRLYNRLDETF